MSIVVAINYKDGVLIGADKQSTCGCFASHDVIKAYKSKYSNTCFGSVGYLRAIDIIHTNIEELMDYKDVLDNKKLDKDYVISKIIPKFFKVLKDNEINFTQDGFTMLPNSFLICSDEKIFFVGNDGGVSEMEKFGTIGCGQDLVRGFLNTKTLEPENITYKEAVALITDAVKVACKDDVYIDDNIDFITLTKSK